MGPATIAFGVLLVCVGLIGYLAARSELALLPTGLGVALLLLGFLARQDHLRKHVMHFAAMLGLLGVVGEIVVIVMLAGPEGAAIVWFLPHVVAAAGCAIFEWMCVRSFINARRARKAV